MKSRGRSVRHTLAFVAVALAAIPAIDSANASRRPTVVPAPPTGLAAAPRVAQHVGNPFPAGPAAHHAVSREPSETEPSTPLPETSEPGVCPPGMMFAEGQHCLYWEQQCLRWDDPIGQPSKRVCAEFKKPSTCTSGRHAMRFCIDRDEFVLPGEQVPVRAVSWTQADLMCTSIGKRLCTNQEWEFACEGEEGLPYPYGYERAPALCNQDRILRDGRWHANRDMREASHATCVSPFGVRDMVGNVDEWVRQPWAKPGKRSELRGGWWMTGRNRCRANTAHHDEKYSGIQTGFRCCRDAESAVARGREQRPGGAVASPRWAAAEPADR